MDYSWIKELKIGDKVSVNYESVCAVEKITPKGFIRLSNERLYDDVGNEKTTNAWHRTRIYNYQDKDVMERTDFNVMLRYIGNKAWKIENGTKSVMEFRRELELADLVELKKSFDAAITNIKSVIEKAKKLKEAGIKE